MRSSGRQLAEGWQEAGRALGIRRDIIVLYPLRHSPQPLRNKGTPAFDIARAPFCFASRLKCSVLPQEGESRVLVATAGTLNYDQRGWEQKRG